MTTHCRSRHTKSEYVSHRKAFLSERHGTKCEINPQYSNTHCGAEFVSMGWQYSYKGMPVFSNIWQCSYVLARLESAWELWGLRTLNIEARHFARLPQLLHNGVALSKRLGLKHRAQSSCKAHGCLCSPVTCRNIALGALAVIQV